MLRLAGGPITETATLSVAKYLKQNGTGFLGIATADQAAFFGAKSLFAAKNLATHCEQEPCEARQQRCAYDCACCVMFHNMPHDSIKEPICRPNL